MRIMLIVCFPTESPSELTGTTKVSPEVALSIFFSSSITLISRLSVHTVILNRRLNLSPVYRFTDADVLLGFVKEITGKDPVVTLF